MHQVDVVGNSLGVRREIVKGIGSSLGWHKRVRQKKTKTYRKIIGGSRKACRELGWSCNGYLAIMIVISIMQEIRRRDREARWEHAERSPKEGQMTCRKNAGGCQIGRNDLTQECRRLSDWR
ncbi:hypothetical protein BHE74_00057615, partial [Ensete ventricosum]